MRKSKQSYQSIVVYGIISLLFTILLNIHFLTLIQNESSENAFKSQINQYGIIIKQLKTENEFYKRKKIKLMEIPV